MTPYDFLLDSYETERLKTLISLVDVRRR